MSFSRREQQLQRYLDGELSPEDAAAFAASMLQDAELRERVELGERLREGFAAAVAAEPRSAAPAGFTAGVLSEVRRLPSREQLQQADLTAGAVQLCRRILLAAIVLLGVGVAVHAGLFDLGQQKTVEAAPDEIEAEMQRLDQQILERMNGK